MNTPQDRYLSNQSFNSKFIEFVWQFPQDKDYKYQVIFKVNTNSTIYLEHGEIDKAGDYKDDGLPTECIDNVDINWLKTHGSDPRLRSLEEYFKDTDVLITLAKEVVEYLK